MMRRFYLPATLSAWIDRISCRAILDRQIEREWGL